jgi:hypothetical protein
VTIRATALLDRTRALIAPAALLAVAFIIYLLCSKAFNAGRPDLFYLADAFLHGREWLTFEPGPYDVVVVDDRVYVPFAPFPAFVLLPLVAVVGPDVATTWQPIVNSVLAVFGLGLLWRLTGRLGVSRTLDRASLVVLFGFSTPIWWVTMRGGVWHTGHLVATILTFAGLLEAYGRRRAWAMGLLAGAAFMTRAPLLAALPYWGWRALPKGLRTSIRDLLVAVGWLALGFAPFLAFSLWYNAARFGNPLESGYYLASLPAFLEVQRSKGLFSPAHLPMNVEYFLWHLPNNKDGIVGLLFAVLRLDLKALKPDGMGLSVIVTSPGLFAALRARWRDLDELALGITVLLVLLPNLLYYGGGWYQYGFRYALDAFPFVMALCALVAARRGMGWIWRTLIVVGCVVNLYGVWWNYHP